MLARWANSAPFTLFPAISAGQTNTMPLHIEQLFQGFNSVGAFAVASVLTLLAVVTLLLKVAVEHKARQSVKTAVQERKGSTV